MMVRNCLILVLLFGNALFGQDYKAVKIPNPAQSVLEQKFKKFDVVKLDLTAIQQNLNQRSNTHRLNILFDKFNWDITLSEFELYSKNYISSIGKNNTIERNNQKRVRTFKVINHASRGSWSCMTVAENFVSGFVEESGVKRFIEPLSYYSPKAESNQFVVYLETDVIPIEGISCGADELEENKHQHDHAVENSLRAGCKTIDIALSCDLSVFNKRGGVSGAENWMISILNLVQTNYDNEFGTAIEFGASATFVPTSTADDPWNGITSIDGQLTKHRTWGNGGGYGAAYAVATNWSTKWSSGTIGLAYVGVICGSFRYNVCSDFGGSNGPLRCLQSHELGHNFDLDHDGGSGFIMSPSVSSSNTWSASSITMFNNYIPTVGCAGTCNSGNPPVADFFGAPEEICPNGAVKFTDESTENPTAWLWTFPGGTPSTSTLQSPSIVYKTAGKYDVTLKVTNSFGNNTKTISQYIEVLPLVINVCSGFTIDRDLYTTNLSQNADSYLWKFGDGNTSVDDSPIHTYAKDGTFTVEMCATNTCGTVCKKFNVNVATPVEANFTADQQEGCASFKVKYRNLSSSNSVTYAWSFPGGTPSVSSEKEPLITYPSKGVYEAKLTVSNSKYSNTKVEKAFVRIESTPDSEFEFKAPVGNSVHFVNNTVDTIAPWKYKFLWKFEDNQTSTAKNPSYTFSKGGKFNVCLITDNGCGKDTLCKEVEISAVLNPGFSADRTNICVGDYVQFKNQSSKDITQWEWRFEGGNPTSSTEVNPKVRFMKPGVYTVALTVKNGSGESKLTRNSYITVKSAILCPDRGGKKSDVPVSETEEDEIVSERNRNSNNNISIVPNPNNGFFTLSLNSNLAKDLQGVQILNSNGVRIQPRSQRNINSGLIEMNLSDINEGVYIMQIKTSKNIYTKKFIIVR
ncbi:MAG: PKD domain-containing protein [Saprospiraceae bacterium]|nr:PKD domain-containing protein [Saprospiraceae bacterium]